MAEAIERCRLDLTERVVLTEAASGAYVVTPIIAGMAGAERVYAVTRETRHGSVRQVIDQTLELARFVGVEKQIEITTRKSAEMVGRADIITNSGHVRPIDAEMIAVMKATAVVPLMYESWELRQSDVDVAACHRRRIAVGGTNEQHPAVGVFDYLGVMAIKLLADASIAVHGSRVLLVCDNAFDSYIERDLVAVGARVTTTRQLMTPSDEPYDAILVALQPRAEAVLGANEAALIAERWPSAIVAQFWGDLDRDALAAHDIPVWPAEHPARGHMGILPADIGPEPIVRLQAGGLKVGEVLLRQQVDGSDWGAEFVETIVPERADDLCGAAGWQPSAEQTRSS
jgi:hypothetical protein